MSSDDKPIKVLLAYRNNDIYLESKVNPNSTYYNFYMKALKRNKNIDVTYQVASIKNHESFDILLLFGVGHHGLTLDLKDVKIPIFTEMGDPHSRDITEMDKYITCFYSSSPLKYVNRYFPKESYNYKILVYGVEPNLFQNLMPFKDRIKNKILNSGAADTPGPRNILRRILHKPKDHTVYRHYQLRSFCNYLKYVDHTHAAQHEYVRDRYPELLQKYQASIAATTEFPTRKYWEIPAAGCLTFMEITEKNFGNHLGYTDGINAIFINEDNYKDKFAEYRSDIDNPKWEKIANAGREYTMNNFNNDIAVEKLVGLMREEMQ